MDRTIPPATEGKDVAAGVGIAATVGSSHNRVRSRTTISVAE